MSLHEPHGCPGKLLIVEGIDGSGKSTQLQLLQSWLASEGYDVFFSEWNSAPLVRDSIKRGKKRHELTPTTFSLLHATDFASRFANDIYPPLKAGMIVFADRYAFTAFARDAARGVDRGWVRNLYSFAPQPDLALYFRIPIEVSLDRILVGRPELKFYEAGLDLALSPDPVTSYKLFQTRVIEEYDAMVNEFGLTVVDGNRPIDVQQKEIRDIAVAKLGLSIGGK